MEFKKWLTTEMALDLRDVSDPFEKEFHNALAKNKKKVILYHGTTTTHFWDIINKGFSFDEKRKNWNGTSPGTYFSFDRDRAGVYTSAATKKAGGEPIIFVLEVPIAIIERDLDDTDTFDKGTNWQSVIKDVVVPKFITGVHYPAAGNTIETPIKKFIAQINKGKVPAIPPENTEPQKRKFATATVEDLEHAVVAYLNDLVQYSSFPDHGYGTEMWLMNQKIIRYLNSLGKDWWFKVNSWNGDKWMKALEQILGEKNTETHYQEQPEFQKPMYQVIRKYGPDIAAHRQFRLGMKNWQLKPNANRW